MAWTTRRFSFGFLKTKRSQIPTFCRGRAIQIVSKIVITGCVVTATQTLAQNPNLPLAIPKPQPPLMSVMLRDGQQVMVHAFTSDPDVAKEYGNYYLDPWSTRREYLGKVMPYIVFYDPKYSYFGISLNQKPYSGFRTAVENLLRQKLDVPNAELCALNYFVSVNDQSSPLAAKNLGFSFCPGATPL